MLLGAYSQCLYARNSRIFILAFIDSVFSRILLSIHCFFFVLEKQTQLEVAISLKFTHLFLHTANSSLNKTNLLQNFMGIVVWYKLGWEETDQIDEISDRY